MRRPRHTRRQHADAAQLRQGRSGVVVRVASWAIAHRRITLLSWLALLVAISIVAHAIGTRQSTNFTVTHAIASQGSLRNEAGYCKHRR